MKYWKHLVCGLLLTLSLGTMARAVDNNASDSESQATQQFNLGMERFKTEHNPLALPYFSEAARLYEQQFKQPGTRYYSARTSAEKQAYLKEAARGKQNAQVTDANWGYAYFMQSYILIDMNQLEQAKHLLQQALALSPHNAQFRSELGHIYQSEKNWELSLSTFRQAADDAARYTPPEDKNFELARAWRGQGYALVELNRLDEAEALYRRCLALDKNDAKAAGELQYVRDLKSQQKP